MEESKAAESLGAKIKEAGDKVRDLKTQKADKVVLLLTQLQIF